MYRRRRVRQGLRLLGGRGNGDLHQLGEVHLEITLHLGSGDERGGPHRKDGDKYRYSSEQGTESSIFELHGHRLTEPPPRG